MAPAKDQTKVFNFMVRSCAPVGMSSGAACSSTTDTVKERQGSGRRVRISSALGNLTDAACNSYAPTCSSDAAARCAHVRSAQQPSSGEQNNDDETRRPEIE